MDWKAFWESSRSTVIAAVIALLVIGGLFVVFNVLPATETGTDTQKDKQEQTKEKKQDKTKKGDEQKEKVGLPAKYTVKPGDNLWKISIAHYGTGYKWPAIASVNSIENPNVVFVGAKLNIPKTTDYKVKSGDTLWDISQKFYKSGFEWTKIRDANPGKIGTLPNGSQALIAVGQTLVIPQ